MSKASNNVYIRSELEHLIATYETEINYNPLNISLDPQQIGSDYIPFLLDFLKGKRKRLFYFNIPGDPNTSEMLSFYARRSVLHNTATELLQNTSKERKINPLKQILAQKFSSLKAGIQIQKNVPIKASPLLLKQKIQEIQEQNTASILIFVPADLSSFPDLAELNKQLYLLGIEKLQDQALKKIEENIPAFKDGIIPNNLPKGFYINLAEKALCFTENPKTLPSALAPKLEKPLPPLWHSRCMSTAASMDPANKLRNLEEDGRIQQLLTQEYSKTQQNTLIKLLAPYSEEVQQFFQKLKHYELEFIVPFLAKQYLYGGEAHVALLARLFDNCITYNLDLQFIKHPETFNALACVRGIKNLQKLTKLSTEQKAWWNTLVGSHIANKANQFDFNDYFEIYTQLFLPKITENQLCLTLPCPIKHDGHMLLLLNRILDVLDHAKNPAEQSLLLSDLNWKATGIHYAMTQAAEDERIKQAAACMNISGPEDLKTSPQLIHAQLHNASLELKPWIYRYMGQHWHAEIKLADIQAQINKIEQLNWPRVQKNQLLFIFACTFANKNPLEKEEWFKALDECLQLLLSVEGQDRQLLLQHYTHCFEFKTPVSLAEINRLLQLSLELKAAFPEVESERMTSKHSEPHFQLYSLITFLKEQGLENLITVQESIRKLSNEDSKPLQSSSQLYSFISEINHKDSAEFSSLTTAMDPPVKPEDDAAKQRDPRGQDLFIQLLCKLNLHPLTQDTINGLQASFNNLKIKKGEAFTAFVLHYLSQINISKSSSLPSPEQIQQVLDRLSNLPALSKPDANSEQQKQDLKNFLIDNELLTFCVFGNDEISKLDELIVSALVDSIKKRSAAFKIEIIKNALQEKLALPLVPQALRNQINKEFIPLLDDMNELIILLQTPNPEFNQVLSKLQNFEQKKPLLLQGIYNIGVLGQSKGEYILSYLLTGKKKTEDQLTGYGLAGILNQLHQLFLNKMNGFFANPNNKIQDLTAKTCLSWMEIFNNTHSLTFFFKEELIEKKVIPALKKTLLQLNINDKELEKKILTEAAFLNEEEPANHSLQHYKNKIESIASYLNSLIDLKNDLTLIEFDKIYQLINTGSLTRLNYQHKHILINQLKNKKEFIPYLNLVMEILEEHPEISEAALTQAISGIPSLFSLSDLDPETQMMFFKMSFIHNLKSPHPFPLAALSELNKTKISESTKSLISKQILFLLSRLSLFDSSELINDVIQKTKIFLTDYPDQALLCSALLKRTPKQNPELELNSYLLILQQLNSIPEQTKNCILEILNNLSLNKNDNFSLSELLELSKRLSNQNSSNLELIEKLFTNAPFPSVHDLSAVLRAPDSAKLKLFCSNFDKNPFNAKPRDLVKHFSSHKSINAIKGLEDLLYDTPLPQPLKLKLAKQLTYLEILGYTDPLNPDEFQQLQKLTNDSREDLQNKALLLLTQLRAQLIPADKLEQTQLDLLAHLREIYYRTTGVFPHSTQMLVLLLALHDPSSNLLMKIRTGEGKSIITPMLSVLQWMQGGTVDQFTANETLLHRDFERYSEPFFKFLQIPCSLIQNDSPTEAYQLGGINCSTFELMANFRLEAKAAHKEFLVKDNAPIHMTLDECDETLLDQILRYNLVAEIDEQKSPHQDAQWIYPLVYKFINLPAFRNLDPKKGKVWDEEEDLHQLRIFLNKEINKQFQDSTEKLNKIMISSDAQLMHWIYASCIAAKQVENKDFIIQPLKEKDEMGNEITKKMVCVPLIRSTPKTGSIFTSGVQRALQARLQAEYPQIAHYVVIDPDPPLIDSQSALGLIHFYQKTKGRLLGISGTPGDKIELQNLATLFGTQAVGVPSHTPSQRISHPPVFTFNREESIQAIFQAIDNVKQPFTKPYMELNPSSSLQIYEELEALNAKQIKTINEWKNTQTQPILIINEHFEDAKAIKKQLNIYKNRGWTVQIVTGQESAEELTQILKKAGHPNTITVGTAMLAKGTDIDTQDHPRGLFVIQTYTDIPRMMEQIPGRTARNEKPGEYLVIYEIKKPTSFWARLLYYLFPWYRQKLHQQSIEKLKTQIQLQATSNRLYTQAIDQIQQVLMQQVEAWEHIILELYPEDSKIQLELYQWREVLLNELNRLQATSISAKDLQLHISQFKKSACKLWDLHKEEKWFSKIPPALTNKAQKIRINYLKQIDLNEELKIQTPLQKKTWDLKQATDELMQNNLETLIYDKAGIVLAYEKPQGQIKKDLEFAQTKQLLAHMIPELAACFPNFLNKIKLDLSSKNTGYWNSLKTLIKQMKDPQQPPESYKKLFNKASFTDITQLFAALNPFMFEQMSCSDHYSLTSQFKIQGLILNFCKMAENLECKDQTKLNKLKMHFQKDIMGHLAEYLILQFAWADKEPPPLHFYLERRDAKIAAKTLYRLARRVQNAPQDQKCIQKLYEALQEHRFILKDMYLFSLGHTSPRKVINEALNAIETLNYAPHCDQSFQKQAHDKALVQYHIKQFQADLRLSDPFFYFQKDPIWEHLKLSLMQISNQQQPHVLLELQEAVQRFTRYSAYQPYLGTLNAFKKKLDAVNKKLKEELKQDPHESLYRQKTSELSALLKLNSNQICIQSGNDGLHNYIQIQLKNAPLQKGFTGYQSSFLPILETEKKRLQNQKLNFKNTENELLKLEDVRVLQTLGESDRKKLLPLFNLKVFLAEAWNEHTIDCINTHVIPENIKNKLKDLKALHLWDVQQINEGTMQTLFKNTPELTLTHTLNDLISLKNQLSKTQEQIDKELKYIKEVESKIKQQEQHIADIQGVQEGPYLNKLLFKGQILYHQGLLVFFKGQLKSSQYKMNGLLQNQINNSHKLKHQHKMLKMFRLEMINKVTEQIKSDLESYLQQSSNQLIQEIIQEQLQVETTLENIQVTETEKSCYQTLKFFKPESFFQYFAELKKENTQIPEKINLNLSKGNVLLSPQKSI